MEGEREQVKAHTVPVYATEIFHIKKRLNDTKDIKEGRPVWDYYKWIWLCLGFSIGCL